MATVLFLCLLILMILPITIGSVEAASTRSIGTPYTTRKVMMQQWFTLESQNPALITHEKIGRSVQGNDLYIFRIGNPAGGAVMWDGSTHGCEDTGTEASYWFTKWLVENGSQRAQNILAGNYWLVIPYVDYDRANGRTNMHGVDLARNFVYRWGTTGSSSPTSEQYRGSYAASEPETNAVRYAQMKYGPQVYFNVHTGLQAIGYAAKDSAANSTGADITERYIAEVESRGTVQEYTIRRTPAGGGFVLSDAYAMGACAFLFETQKWEDLPVTLDEWRSQWYPHIEPIILASLESVQGVNAPPPPSAMFSDGFESGSLSSWDGASMTTGEIVNVTSGVQYDGVYGAIFASEGSGGTEGAFCHKSVPEKNDLFTRCYIYPSELGLVQADDCCYFLVFNASNESVFCAGWRMSDEIPKWTLALYNGTAWNETVSVPSLNLSQWYCVELHWRKDAIAGGGELYVNGMVVCSISAMNTSGLGVDVVRFGLAEICDCNATLVYGDRCVMSTKYIGSDVNDDPPMYTLACDVVGSGSVDKNPDQDSYVSATVVTLTANPAVDWSFIGWSGDLDGIANPTTITINGSKVVTATFTLNPPTYSLTVNYTGTGSGDVTKDPNQTSYAPGESVVLTANPESGSTFAGWSGDFSTTDNPVTVIINRTTSVTATFTQDPYSLTVTVAPSSAAGTVSADIGAPYDLDDVVTLTPTASPGYAFSNWSGDGVNGTGNTRVVIVTSNMVVTATFTQDEYALTVTIVGNGSVNLNSTGPFYYGTVVEATAAPALGWTFESWNGDLSGSTNPTMITIDGNKAAMATFTQNTYTLAVTIVGSGSVNLNNSGPYFYGDVVESTAVPVEGWSFQSWSGDLSGSSNPATISINRNMVVTATFNQAGLFADGLESGSFSAWSSAVPTITSGETATVNTVFPYTGIYGAAFSSSGSVGYEVACIYESLLPSESELYVQGYFRVAQSGIVQNDDRFYFIRFRSGSNDLAYAGWRMVGGVLRWSLLMRNGNGWVSAVSTGIPSAGQWYSVELHWRSDPVNGGGELYVNGAVVCSISGVNTATLGNVNVVRFGLADVYNCDATLVYADSCVMSTTYIGTGPPPPPANVALESLENTLATSNLGSVNLDNVGFTLPHDTSKNTGSYSVEYSAVSGYVFDHWETTGLISVNSLAANPTAITISGDGALRAIYKLYIPSQYLFADGFESGSFSAWTSSTITSDETATVTSALCHHGTYCALFTSNGNGGTEVAYCYKTVGSSVELYARGYFRVATSGIVEDNDRVHLIVFRSGTQSIAFAGWRKTGGVVKWTLIVRDGTGWATAYSTASPALNTWYSVELHWKKDSTNGLGELWVDGTKVCSMTRKNTTAFGNVDRINFGLGEVVNCGSTTVYGDCAMVSATYIGPET